MLTFLRLLKEAQSRNIKIFTLIYYDIYLFFTFEGPPPTGGLAGGPPPADSPAADSPASGKKSDS
jgi:hypothetical protein